MHNDLPGETNDWVGGADFMAAFSYSLGGPGDLVLFGCFQGGWVGVKGNCWEMKSMGPCFRPGWAKLGVGSCHFICSADPAQSMEDVVWNKIQEDKNSRRRPR